MILHILVSYLEGHWKHLVKFVSPGVILEGKFVSNLFLER